MEPKHLLLLCVRKCLVSTNMCTRDHNVNVLHNLGYFRVKNTTIFKNRDKFILSPAVAKNTNGKYWFDIREVNLNRINPNSLLLVRIVPDMFILEEIKSVSSLLSKELMDNRPNSGNVWGIHIEMRELQNSAFIFNIKDIDNKLTTKLLEKSEINKAFNRFENFI